MSDPPLTLYTHPMSRGQIARWMLEEVGEPYEEVLLNYYEGSKAPPIPGAVSMKDPNYLALNSMGKVPTVVHNGQVVTEAAAICLYLADAFPEKGLAPAPGARADYYRWTLFAAGPMEQAILCQAQGWGVDSVDKEATAGFGSFDRTMDALETALTDRRYIAGDAFSAADVYLGACLDFGMAFQTIPERSAFTAYVAPLRERQAYKRFKAIEDAHMAQMMGGA